MKIINPWKKLNETRIYENQWIQVDEHIVLNPKGNRGLYGKVSFKNKAIGIIPVDDKMNTWLVGQFRYTLNEYSWEIPMGGGPPDQDILVSASRELREETGITAKEWKMILHIHTSNSVTDEEGFVFLAQQLSFGDTDFDETELLEIKKISLTECLRMVTEGRITDSLSIGGLLMAGRIFGI